MLLPRGSLGTLTLRYRGWVSCCHLKTLASVVIRCAACSQIQVACFHLWTGLACSLWPICSRRLIFARLDWDFLTSASYLAGQGDLWKKCCSGEFVGRKGSGLVSIVARIGSALGHLAPLSCDN